MRKLFSLVQKKKHANKTANSALKKDKYAIRPAMRSCLLHLMRQNRFLKTFLANLISMTQISLFLLVMIWKSAISTVNPKLGKKFTKSLDLSKFLLSLVKSLKKKFWWTRHYSVFSDFQYGFRCSWSTSDSLIR